MTARGSEMILLHYEVASIDMQLCLSSCEQGYLSRLATLVPAVRSGPDVLSRRLSLNALPELWDVFDVLKIPVR